MSTIYDSLFEAMRLTVQTSSENKYDIDLINIKYFENILYTIVKTDRDLTDILNFLDNQEKSVISSLFSRSYIESLHLGHLNHHHVLKYIFNLTSQVRSAIVTYTETKR